MQVASAQAGLITAAQLAEIGVPTSTVARRTRPGGMWSRILPGVHLVTGGRPDGIQREMAALLYAGPGAVLTGLTALRHVDARLCRALWVPEDHYVTESVHVLIPHDRRRLSPSFVDAERTRNLPTSEQVIMKQGLLLAPPARAICDACRRLRSEPEVRSLVLAAVRDGVTDAATLMGELKSVPRRGSAFLRSAIESADQRVWSPAEADLRAVLAGTSLPTPLWNVHLLGPDGRFIAIPDAWFDDVGLAVEVDSRQHHSAGQDWERTLARQARYASAGVLCVPVTPRQIRDEPDAVIRQITQAYAAASRRPRPPVTTVVVPQRPRGHLSPLSWGG